LYLAISSDVKMGAKTAFAMLTAVSSSGTIPCGGNGVDLLRPAENPGNGKQENEQQGESWDHTSQS
jgi:hypothetical protein